MNQNDQIQHDEEKLEQLYWEFDKARKQSGEERWHFKGLMRGYAAHVNEPSKIENESDDVLTKAGNVNHNPDTGKMVRLTDDSLISIYLACKAEWKTTNKRQRQRIALIFGNAIMDAMIKKNGGAHATD